MSGNDPGADTRSRVADLFAVFNSRYGGLFTHRVRNRRLYDITLGDWARTLAGYSEAEFAAGIEALDDNYPDAPPSPGQFKRLCRPVVNPIYNTRRDHLLPPPPVDGDVVADNLAQMRSTLAGHRGGGQP